MSVPFMVPGVLLALSEVPKGYLSELCWGSQEIKSMQRGNTVPAFAGADGLCVNARR